MALHMTPELREKFEKELAAGEPYFDDEMRVLDGGPKDYARVSATFAKKFLEEADKREANKQD